MNNPRVNRGCFLMSFSMFCVRSWPPAESLNILFHTFLFPLLYVGNGILLVSRELPLCCGYVVPMVAACNSLIYLFWWACSSFPAFCPIHEALVYILMHTYEGICERDSQRNKALLICIKLVLVTRLLEQKGFIFSLGGTWPGRANSLQVWGAGQEFQMSKEGKEGQSCEVGISVPLQKLKEVQSFAKGHTVNKWQNWDLNSSAWV